MKQKIILIFVALALGLGLTAIKPASAQNGSENRPSVDEQSKQQAATQLEQRRQAVEQEYKQKLEDLKQQAKAQQEQKKADICAKVRTRLTTKHDHIKNLIAEIANRIDQRVDRVKAFVSKNNLTVANYDSLLSDITAKKQAVVSARADVVSAISSFDCNSNERKSQEANVKTKVEAYKTAIQAYKKSVRNLLTAVKTATEAELKSPTPTSQAAPGSQG